jgi:hypothetical protein
MEAEESVGIKARSVLWYLTFVGFAMNYMIRININIAIVDMISSDFRGKSVVMSECVTSFNSSNLTFAETSGEQEVIEVARDYVSIERRFLDFVGVWCDWGALSGE